MDHKKSIFQFEAKGVEWRVEYYYAPSIYGGNSLCAAVYEGEELYHDFDRLPSTRTDNPTKTQAKEIIAAAKKINKERDTRDSKIKKILDGAKQTD